MRTKTVGTSDTPPAACVVRLQDSECLSINCTGPYVRIINRSLGHAIAPALTSESSIAIESWLKASSRLARLDLEQLGLRAPILVSLYWRYERQILPQFALTCTPSWFMRSGRAGAAAFPPPVAMPLARQRRRPRQSL